MKNKDASKKVYDMSQEPMLVSHILACVTSRTCHHRKVLLWRPALRTTHVPLASLTTVQTSGAKLYLHYTV